MKARVDLAEAEAELRIARSGSERAVALERIEDARARLRRWSHGVQRQRMVGPR